MENENMYIKPAERGKIYDFIESDGTIRNKVLVVSSNGRALDKMISILMIGDNPAGYDIVPIFLDNKYRYVHCGMVTYAKRCRLGDEVAKVPDYVMEAIDEQICRNLGLDDDLWVYKHLYEELLDKVTVIKEN